MSDLNGMIFKSKFLDYNVVFQNSLRIPKEALVIADVNVALKHKVPVDNQLETLRISEEEKNLSSVMKIVELFQSHGVRRTSSVVFLGGGVIQDLGTFASSIYMRGVDWIYYPTTMQSMIDSCVGGKSSLNFGTAKNLLGNYYPPSEIRIWPGFLSTLTKDQIVSGLLEGLKICAAANCVPKFVELMNVYVSSDFKSELPVMQLISLSLDMKRRFVEEDEFDLGIRRTLNYGHTFGHALESASGYRIDHGVAVGIGMIAAHILARDLGLIEAGKTTTETAIFRLFDLLKPQLRLSLSKIDTQNFVEFLKGDKKTTIHDFIFILPSEFGLKIQKLPLTKESEVLISSAINSAILGVIK